MQDPVLRRTANEWISKAYGRFKAQMNNGAGLPMDTLLREFALEYNSRLINRAPNLPISWNVASSFLAWHEENRLLYIRPERDHLIALDDFTSFAAGLSEADIQKAWSTLPDGEVSHFNMIGPIDAFSLITPGGKELCVSGLSMTKEQGEIACMVLGGIVNDPHLSEQNNPMQPDLLAAAEIHGPQASKLKLSTQKVGPVRLFGADTHPTLRVVAMARMHPISKETRFRIIYRDLGSFYQASTDCPDHLAAMPENQREKAVQNALDDLNEHGAFFDLMTLAPALPLYMAYRKDQVIEERHDTKLARQAARNEGDTKNGNAGLFPEARVVYRRVQSIRPIRLQSHAPDRRTYSVTPPAYRVNVEGFWRTLLPGQHGHDPDGLPIQGRTWVKSHIRWRERPEPPRTVLVKQRIDPPQGEHALVIPTNA